MSGNSDEYAGAAETGNGGHLKKSKVGIISLVSMYYALICSGAYGIEEMISSCGPGMSLLILVLLPIFWAFPIGFVCAELGSARPDEGGVLMWVKEAMGEFWFGIVLVCMTIWGLIANAVYVVMAVNYLAELIHISPVVSGVLKVAIVLFFFLLNVKGVKEVGFLSAVLTITIVVMFAAVAVVGIMNWNQSPITPFIADPQAGTFAAIGAGLNIGLWMYCGFDQISMMSGEIHNAQRLIPKALMIAIPVISLTYILPTLGGLVSIGSWEQWTTEPGGVGYATVLIENNVPTFGAIFLGVAVLAQLAAYNMTIAAAARGVYIFAEENFGPRWIASISKKFGTPLGALALTSAVTLALIPFDFTFLITLEVFFMALVYALMMISGIILKRRLHESEFLFKFPGGKRVHLIASISVLFICLLVTIISGIDYYFGGLIAVVILPIFYVFAKRKYKGSSAKESNLYPIDPRTKIGFGDFTKIGYYYLGMGVYAIVSKFFLAWYEGEWGAAYYLEEYETGIFSNMDLMLNSILIIGVVCLIVGAISLSKGKKLDADNKQFMNELSA